MASRFVMMVVDKATGIPAATYDPGKRAEIDLVKNCTDAIIAKGVGLFRTEAQVRQAIKDGIEETIHELKSRVRP